MTTIIAFAVSDEASGREALDRLAGLVDDTAVAFRDEHGVVTVRQASDLDGGSGDIAHGLLGVAVALATTSSHELQTGERAHRARLALVRSGVHLDELDLAGEQVDAGAAAAFMVADDDTAVAIESALRTAGYRNVRRVHMPEQAAGVLRDTQRLEAQDCRPGTS